MLILLKFIARSRYSKRANESRAHVETPQEHCGDCHMVRSDFSLAKIDYPTENQRLISATAKHLRSPRVALL